MMEQNERKNIGGFFELEWQRMTLQSGDSVAALWHLPNSGRDKSYVNARSALAALLRVIRPSRLWLPAYICESVAHAARNCGHMMAICYFPQSVRHGLAPDTSFLEKSLKSGDAILAVNYFGYPPPLEFRALAKSRADVTFIEDCAQSLDTGVTPWGNWRIFSPRKLLGVADGGYAVPLGGGTTAIPQPIVGEPMDFFRIWQPAILRYECPKQNEIWHPLNQAKERDMAVCDTQASRLSCAVLDSLPWRDIATRRKENYQRLLRELSRHAYLQQVADSAFAPFGFPVRLASKAQRDAVQKALIEKNIFSAIHWEILPSSSEAFPEEHRLSKEMLTLPCDHRYGAEDMQTVAEEFMNALCIAT